VIFHLLNPWPTSWEAIRFVVAGVLGEFAGKEMEMVSVSDWVQRMRRSVKLWIEQMSSRRSCWRSILL
jgi:hypothetical protein